MKEEFLALFFCLFLTLLLISTHVSQQRSRAVFTLLCRFTFFFFNKNVSQKAFALLHNTVTLQILSQYHDTTSVQLQEFTLHNLMLIIS